MNNRTQMEWRDSKSWKTNILDKLVVTEPVKKNPSTIFSSGVAAPIGPGPLHYRHFTITLRHTTLGRTPLEEWSARRREPSLTTHNNHKRQTSMRLAGFELIIPASERPPTHALDHTATGIGIPAPYPQEKWNRLPKSLQLQDEENFASFSTRTNRKFYVNKKLQK
jgi:hypothetical protein